MNERTARIASVALAVLAAGLMLFALMSMAQSEFAVAGLSFMSASIIIYYRETAIQ